MCIFIIYLDVSGKNFCQFGIVFVILHEIAKNI